MKKISIGKHCISKNNTSWCFATALVYAYKNSETCNYGSSYTLFDPVLCTGTIGICSDSRVFIIVSAEEAFWTKPGSEVQNNSENTDCGIIHRKAMTLIKCLVTELFTSEHWNLVIDVRQAKKLIIPICQRNKTTPGA